MDNVPEEATGTHIALCLKNRVLLHVPERTADSEPSTAVKLQVHANLVVLSTLMSPPRVPPERPA